MADEARHRIRAWLSLLAEQVQRDPTRETASIAVGALQALALAGVLDDQEVRAWSSRLAIGEEPPIEGLTARNRTPTAPKILPHAATAFAGRQFDRTVPLGWSPHPSVLVSGVDVYDDALLVHGHVKDRDPGLVDIDLYGQSGDRLGQAGGFTYVIGEMTRWEFAFARGIAISDRSVTLEVDGNRRLIDLGDRG